MSHLEHETLWALAKAELPAENLLAAQAHLAQCPDCRVTLEDIRLTQASLTALPAPPPMPAAMARRVGEALQAEAERRARPGFFGLPFFSAWPHAAEALVLAAIAVALVVAVVQRSATPESPAPPPVAQVPPTPAPAPGPAPVPGPKAPPAPAVKKLSVQVASARKAHGGSGALSRKQVLAEGASVSTDKGGALWLSLPDGSRAGLTGSTDVQLAKLEADALTLDVAQGSLAMVVPHREDRVLLVRAGEVVVKDLGTRFLVSRDVARVVVAVEEGSVQVTTPEREETVRAGHALTWEAGHATRATWEVPRPAVVAERPPSSAAKLAEDEGDVEPQPQPSSLEPTPQPQPQPSSLEPQPTLPSGATEAPATAPVYGPPGTAPEGEWAALPQAQPSQPQAQPPPMVQPLPSAPPPRRVSVSSPPPFSGVAFSLKEVERRLHELKRTIRDPLMDHRPVEVRGVQAGDVAEMAEDGDCMGALLRADAWLSAPPTTSGQELGWRRQVLRQKVRCLVRLHRDGEAAQVQAELDGLPQ